MGGNAQRAAQPCRMARLSSTATCAAASSAHQHRRSSATRPSPIVSSFRCLKCGRNARRRLAAAPSHAAPALLLHALRFALSLSPRPACPAAAELLRGVDRAFLKYAQHLAANVCTLSPRLPHALRVAELLRGVDRAFLKYAQHLAAKVSNPGRLVPPLPPVTRYKKPYVVQQVRGRRCACGQMLCHHDKASTAARRAPCVWHLPTLALPPESKAGTFLQRLLIWHPPSRARSPAPRSCRRRTRPTSWPPPRPLRPCHSTVPLVSRACSRAPTLTGGGRGGSVCRRHAPLNLSVSCLAHSPRTRSRRRRTRRTSWPPPRRAWRAPSPPRAPWRRSRSLASPSPAGARAAQEAAPAVLTGTGRAASWRASPT